jgi:hypothetical protein
VTPRRSKTLAASESRQPAKPGLKVFPHQLRVGDVVIDESGAAWALFGRPIKIVGTQDFVSAMRRVDRPADIREGRWKAHERVRVRQR